MPLPHFDPHPAPAPAQGLKLPLPGPGPILPPGDAGIIPKVDLPYRAPVQRDPTDTSISSEAGAGIEMRAKRLQHKNPDGCDACRWQYLVVPGAIEQHLDYYGSNGWELCSVLNRVGLELWVFKRPQP